VNFLKWLFISLWVVGISAVVGVVHSWHFADLSPEKESLSINSFSSNVEKYGVLHFLSPACSCSQTVIDHLLSRGPLSGQESKETIVLIDDHKNIYLSKFFKKKFNVLTLSSDDIKKDYDGSIRGVPLLAIYDSKKTTRYVGGYSEKQITPFSKIDIKSFIDNLDKGRTIASKPVIGCAVSKEFQKLLDPFGLKYSEVKK
jgi:hypothetical protein